MKHAREDYNRIQDPAGLIPEDEPVFLLRGQDSLAPSMLHNYASAVQAAGGDPKLVDMVNAQAVAMKEWQNKVKCKFPDLPK